MIVLDYKSRKPMFEQVVERISSHICKGILLPDEQLPSVRNLASQLSLNPNTIQRAYNQLEATGFIYSVKGKGSFVCSQKELNAQMRKQQLNEMTECVKQGKAIGIERDEVLALIEELYKEERL